jgi:predicted transcriptional regulator
MKRELEGEKSRRQLLFFIEENQGLTNYEISQRLQWSRGKVAYHLKKLLNRGEIRFESSHANPHQKKRYYIVKWEEMIDWSKIPPEKRPPKSYT